MIRKINSCNIGSGGHTKRSKRCQGSALPGILRGGEGVGRGWGCVTIYQL